MVFSLTQSSGLGQSLSRNVRLYVCDVAKHPHLGVLKTFGWRTYSLYWPVMTQFDKKVGILIFSLRLFKRVVFDQPTVDNWGVSRGRSVAVAVGRWPFALQWHFNGTSLTLPLHLQNKNLSVTICIGHGDTLRGFKFVRKDQRGTRVVLLALLFSPDYHTSKKVYLWYTADILKVHWYKGTPWRGLGARIK